MKRILLICLIFVGCSTPKPRGIEVDINDIDDEVYPSSKYTAVAYVSTKTTRRWWLPPVEQKPVKTEKKVWWKEKDKGKFHTVEDKIIIIAPNHVEVHPLDPKKKSVVQPPQKVVKRKFNHPKGTLAWKYNLPEHGFEIITSDEQIGFPFSQDVCDRLKKEFE